VADGIKLEIVSPEKLVVSATASSVTVPGSEGYFTVMGEHAPLMTTLKPGFVSVTEAGGATQLIYVRGGFADISPEGLTILAEEARPAADFSRTEIEAEVAAAQRDVDSSQTLEEKDAAQTRLDSWRNLLLEAGTAGATVAH
jgi:F-type H+-transporting ATPase subunit epsilon